jgi:hypothetical protein
LQKGNYEKAIEILFKDADSSSSKATSSDEGEEYFQAFAEKAKATADKKGGIKDFEITKEAISEDGLKATVSVKIAYGDGTTDDEDINFVKKDGVWKTDLGK